MQLAIGSSKTLEQFITITLHKSMSSEVLSPNTINILKSESISFLFISLLRHL